MNKIHCVKTRRDRQVTTWCGKYGTQAPNTGVEYDTDGGSGRFEVAVASPLATCKSCRRAVFGKWRS